MAERLTGDEFALYFSTTAPDVGYDADPSAYTPDIADYDECELVNSFSIDGSRNIADLTTWSDDDDGFYKPGRRERNVSVSGILDAEEDAGQKAAADAFDADAGALYFLLMPPGAAQVVRHGKLIATGYSEGYEQDAGVTFSASGRLTGPLVRTKTAP